MRGLSLLGLLGLGFLASAVDLRPRDYESNDYYVLHLDSTAVPVQIARRLGLIHEGQLGELEDHHIFSAAKRDTDVVQGALKEQRQLRKRGILSPDLLDGVKLAEKQKLKPRLEKRGVLPPPPEDESRLSNRDGTGANHEAVLKQADVARTLGILDPIFNEQWHLLNTVEVGHDINVTNVWLQGITGHNATVAIVDDGLDMYSDDLKDTYFAAGSYDFNDQNPEPKPKLSDDRHGTRCAGEVAAAKNNVCGVGVAYDSRVAGIRILSKLITDADEALAMNFAYQLNQIYSCSWGPPDDGRAMLAPGILIKRAMLNGIQKGRGGLGSIFVFAAGNGAPSDDNCNFDGYTNSIYSITVGAIDRKGNHPYYSEKCSAQMVVAYSSGSGDAIHTTDVGVNSCTASHGGTSAAAPLGAGVYALVLSIRPDLSWRDLQYLQLQTAVPVHLDDPDEWQTTATGKKFSHSFGYGKIDTWAIVEAAKTFKSVKPQTWFFSPWIHVNQNIPEGETGLAVQYEVTVGQLKEANFARVEHVTVTMNIAHTRRGDLSVDLISPAGLVSHLSTARRLDDEPEGYVDWTFMSVVHWGETGVGTWTIIVKDTEVNEFNGTFTDWHLKLWGESVDPKKAKLLPMPSDKDDDNHTETAVSTTTIKGATTSVSPQVPTHSPVKPSGHPDRPVVAKPSPTNTATSIAETMPTGTASPAETTSATPSNSSWLPSFFPTFGVSPHTQAWIYGALALIVAFCIGLGVYFYLARRKRRANARDTYEFEMVPEEEVGLTAAGAAGSRGKGKRRAGELYDAFATGSDDEEEFLSDVEEGVYKDREREHHVIGDDEEEEEEQDEKEAERRMLQ